MLYVFLISVAVFVFCAVQIIHEMREKRHITTEYSKLSEFVHTPERDRANDFNGNDNPKDMKEITESNKEGIDYRQMKKLFRKNKDVFGWLSIPLSGIDYPVMLKMEDSDFYLNHDFYGIEDKHGVPFLDSRCLNDIDEPNYLIYGHHMRDGTMFAGLMKYKEKKYFEAHKTIFFSTLEEQKEYEVISVCLVNAKTNKQLFEYLTSEITEDKITKLERLLSETAIFSCGEKIQVGAELLSLSTCDYTSKDARLVVVSRKRMQYERKM